MRTFSVHSIERGLIDLAEIREDGEVIGVPVSLPTGTALKAESGFSWIVLRQVGKSVAFNRVGAKVGMRFYLCES